MVSGFFNDIVYSSSTEDSESERRALRLTSQDVVLCITGSGARSLDLLVDSPRKIISIDFNVSQNRLLELKIGAYNAFQYEEFLAFLGVLESKERLRLYERLQPHLSQEAQAFWSERQHLVEAGVLYCGTWERILATLLRISAFRRGTIRRLLSAATLDDQRALWSNRWDTITWSWFLKLICNQWVWVNVVREPGASLIPKTFDVAGYMRSRLNHMANHFLLRESHYSNLLFNGRYLNSCVLPHYLRKEHFETIRCQLDKIEIVTGSLTEFLSTRCDDVSAFSLSDFSSYAPPLIYKETWRKVINAATDGATFCERFFLVKESPEREFPQIIRDGALEEQLFQEDETAIYTFAAGIIRKTT